jgi:hypothetical protein
LVSMLSPVWRATLCSEIGINKIGFKKGWTLNMEEDDVLLFSKLVDLGCGKSVKVVRGLDELIEMLRLADRYQVEAIQGEMEAAVIDRLTVENCVSILTATNGSGLVRLERASRKLALREFDHFAQCAGFMDVSEEVLESLLDDDALVSESEERVLKGVVRWMKGGDGGVIRGEGLLRKIRFPFMSALFLLEEARVLLPEHSGLEGLALEAAGLKSVPRHLWAGRELRYLDAAVLLPRRGKGVNWAENAGDGERRLAAGQWVYSVSAHGRGLMCGGLHDGSIRVWNRATLEVERTLAGHTSHVWALVSAEGWLISGSDDHAIRVWDLATGRCEGTLEGHTDRVRCLAVSGSRLVSGSWDGTAKVWRMEGAVSTWRCERTLAGHGRGHGGRVYCVATWGGKVASGSKDKTIRVWDVLAGTHEQTLAGHEGSVMALVACGQRLISSSADKTVKVWSMATWACVQTVQAYAAGSVQYIYTLAVSGLTLVGGSCSDTRLDTEEYEARVWDLETLEPLNTLRQPAGQRVLGLASDGGELWGAGEEDVVVWGRRG